MDRLISYINHYYQDQIKSAELTEEQQKELRFLERINYDIRLHGKDALMKMNLYDLVTALFYSTMKDVTLDEAREYANKLHLEGIGRYNLCFEIAGIMKPASDLDLVDEMARIPYDYSKNDPYYQMIKKAGLEKDLIELHKLLKSTLCPTEEAKEALFELMDIDGKYLADALIIVGATNRMRTENERREKQAAGFFGFMSESEEAEMDFTISLRVTKGLQTLDSLQNRINEIKRIPKQIEKDNNNINKRKEKVISIVKSFDLSKPIDINPSTFESLKDEKIKYIVIRYILLHNSKFQAQTVERIKQEENIDVLEKIFKKSCFRFDALTDEQKQNLSLYGNMDDIEKMMALFTESKFKIYDDNFPIYEILLLSKPSIVSTINKLIDTNRIAPMFAKLFPTIFIDEVEDEKLTELTGVKKGCYSALLSNIDRLKDKKINTNSLSKSVDVEALIQSEEKLTSVLNLIDRYKLNYASSSDFSLLSHPELISIADRFIELGLSKFIRNNPKYINKETFGFLNRMELCRELGMDIIVDNKLSPRIMDQYFRVGRNVISDEELKEYVPNAVNYYLDDKAYKAIATNKDMNLSEQEIKELESFSVSDYEYDINGIIISKPKVLRNMAILNSNSDCSNLTRQEKLFNSIICGSVLDEDKIRRLTSTLTETFKKLEKK